MNAVTQISPQVTEAMSVSDLLAECRSISALLGPKAEARVSVMPRYNGNDVTIWLYPAGMSSMSETVEGKSFPETFAAARAWIATNGAVRRNGRIRKMSLEIIDITDEYGSCHEETLRAKGFTSDEITEFSEAACARASGLAKGAPFSVLMEMV